MRTSGVFCELDGESDCAPRRWAFGPDDPVPVRFGIHSSVPVAEAAIAYTAGPTTDPPASRTAPAERLDEHRSPPICDHMLFSCVLPALGREGAYRYRLGYRDPNGTWQWMAEDRVIVITGAPRSLNTTERHFLGCVKGRAVYGPVPRDAATPSPADWRKRLFYSVIVDRFAQGEPERRGLGFVRYDPSDPHASHGGTLKGLESKLDYLADLGIGALILNPVYVNTGDGYHGYHPVHLLAVDPRLGDMEDLRNLVRAAHARGIAVLIDIIVNHLADVVVWEPAPDGFRGRFRFDLDESAVPLPYPLELQHPDFFHAPTHDGLVGAPLFGFLADWRTEHGHVADSLIAHLKYWIAETDVDGLRFDAVRHVDLEFWRRCVPEIDGYCRSIGKADFLMLGEHAGRSAEEVGVYSTAAGFPGMIDYPFHYLFRGIFDIGDHVLPELSEYFDKKAFCYRDSRANLTFIDNQDTSRFLHDWGPRFGSLETARQTLRAALALLIFGPGMPSLYYGTEQEYSGAIGQFDGPDGDSQGHDCHVREDMFSNPECRWIFGAINTPPHPPFDRSNPTFSAIRRFADLRRSIPALFAGDRHTVIGDDEDAIAWLMWDDGDGVRGGDLLMVAMNFSATRRFRHRLNTATIAPSLPLPGALSCKRPRGPSPRSSATTRQSPSTAKK